MNYVLKYVVIKTLKDFLSVGSLQVKTARSLYIYVWIHVVKCFEFGQLRCTVYFT
jgi:hypothetical protein